MFNGGVRDTDELRRIVALPRRDLASKSLDHLVRDMTDVLRRPGGTMTLRRVQALALYEIALLGGAFCSVGVGDGKTLISLLAPWVLEAKRPLLVLPAGLIGKTNRDREELAKHWLIPTNIRLFSYEMLGREQAAAELETYGPDLILGDEIQKLKNPDAAVTKRMTRYMTAHPDTRFVALSGTMMQRSLLDFAHVLRWCAKGDACPLPLGDVELYEWASALDVKVANEFERYEPGALLRLAGEEDKDADDVTRARRGFQRRLTSTPCVVSTTGIGEAVTQSIYLGRVEYPLSATTIDHFDALRGEMLLPGGIELFEPMEVWAHARELALGFHSEWQPQPPDEWRLPRKAWHKFVRRALRQYSDELDSESQVASACLEGKLPRRELDAWLAVRDTFVPNPVPVWHDDGALKACLAWMKKRPGLVWTSHTFFARRLAELAGTKYYGREGLADDGEFIDDAPNGKAIVVSADANREGRNLQKRWSRNLIVSPEGVPDWWEQLIGRTHRTGQTADEVIVEVFCGCLEHLNAFRSARIGARVIRDTTGAAQKLLLADVDWPSEEEIARMPAPRFAAPAKKAFQIPV